MVKKKKIPLPWADEFNEHRQIQTLEYWTISQSWNGRSANSKGLTVQDAIARMINIMNEIDPSKKLAAVVSSLKCNVVEFGTKSRMEKHLKAMNINQTYPLEPCKLVLL